MLILRVMRNTGIKKGQMDMLRFLTAGESHGKSLSVIIEGLPAGMLLQPEDIDRDLRRRQVSYGRGGGWRLRRIT